MPDQPTQPTPEEKPRAEASSEAASGAEGHAAHETPASPPPPPSAAAYPPPPYATSPSQGRFQRFARHRATHLVAAGLAGVIIGGGAVALADHVAGPGPGWRGGPPPAARYHHPGPGPGPDRPWGPWGQ